ncbi:hypothetical protein, partial [Pseudomonas sp. VA159-2]|uniref:hypothetical protein n=1 Tax=Pseudomonas sp. VA159-2 TaxID=2956728 RepID=UPI002097E3F4
VPTQASLLAIVQAMDQVAAFVVLVVGPGVFTQQVTASVAFQRAVQLLGLVVQQVTGRVEGEGLFLALITLSGNLRGG